MRVVSLVDTPLVRCRKCKTAPACVVVPVRLWVPDPSAGQRAKPADEVTALSLCAGCLGIGARTYLSRMRDVDVLTAVLKDALGEAVSVVGAMEYGTYS